MRALLILLLLAACARPLPPGPPVGESPLLHDPAQVASAERLTILIPGALASVEIFGPPEDWTGRGHGLARYRFPGMDGLALDHALDIEAAAREIARFAARHPDKPLALVGYSTGAAIALSAAAQIDRPLTVAAISPAPERGGGLATLARGAADVLRAATRAERLSREAIWKEYWKTLLYGRDNRDDPAFAGRIAALSADHEARITRPDPALVRAHSEDLRQWRLPSDTKLAQARIGYFIGLEDPVFTPGQTDALRRRAGGGRIIGFRDDGHLLLLTRPRLFGHVRRFLDRPHP